MLEQGNRAFPAAPPAAVSRILSTFDRNQLANFIEVAIGLLDVASDDPDLEDDDPSGQCDEDGINTQLTHQWGMGLGCEISDEDFCPLDHGELTSENSFYQGEGSCRHRDDDDEPARGPTQWPVKPRS